MQIVDTPTPPGEPAGALERLAATIRRRFDRWTARIGSAALVVALGTAAAAAAALQELYLNWYSPIEVAIVRLEVTFSARRFFALLHAASETARGRQHIVWSFATFDVAFPLFYGPFLCALYLWVERWRRYDASGTASASATATVPARHAVFVLAPLAAAILDVAAENSGLFLAGVAGSTSILTDLLVMIASAASVVKWLLLLVSIGAIVCEVFAGPRGAVLWRVRFSAIAAALGSLPLIVVAQGQDILQRLFDTDHPLWRLFITGVPPLIFGALASWYFARKLTELQLDEPDSPVRRSDWYPYFAEHIPRVLGAALLGTAGVAYAQAGAVAILYAVVALAGYVGVFLVRRCRPALLEAIGKPLLPATWERVPQLSRELGGAVLASVVAMLLSIVSLSQHGLSTPFYHALAAALCLVSAWFFQLFVAFRRAVRNVRTAQRGQQMPERPQVDVVALGNVSRGLRRAVIVAAAVSAAFLVLFTWQPVPAGRALGVLWVLALAVVNAAFLGSVSVWTAKRFHVPVVRILLLVALLFSIWNGSHDVRVIGASIPDRIVARPSISQRFDTWLEGRPDADAVSRSVVLVAAAGGGLRAAYWTAMSLAALADANPQFAPHVFAVSGVSGGSLGGALFSALVQDGAAGPESHCAHPATETHTHGPTSGAYATCVRDFMRDDFLSPVLSKLLAPDLVQWFLPSPLTFLDRSRALESSWSASYARVTQKDTFERGFLELSEAEASSLPLLLFNATHVESGHRYIASPVYKSVDADGGSREFFDNAGDLLRKLEKDLPLASAIHNSARFTYISPAGHIQSDDGEDHGEVVDGGYFENSGLATLGEVYRQLVARGVTPYVLYLCNDPQTCGQPDPDLFAPSVADEVVAPLQALFNTRDARASFAEVSLRNEVGREHFLQLNVCGDRPFEPGSSNDQARERVVRPPLGWVLSAMARDWMDGSLSGTAAPPSSSTGAMEPSKPDCYSDNAGVIARLKTAIR